MARASCARRDAGTWRWDRSWTKLRRAQHVPAAANPPARSRCSQSVLLPGLEEKAEINPNALWQIGPGLISVNDIKKVRFGARAYGIFITQMKKSRSEAVLKGAPR